MTLANSFLLVAEYFGLQTQVGHGFFQQRKEDSHGLLALKEDWLKEYTAILEGRVSHGW